MSTSLIRSLLALPRAVVAIGLVSCFNDLASEMVTPLIPLILASGAGSAIALGFIEGLAEAIASLLKLWAGKKSDRLHRRKPLAIAGYTLSNLARPLMGLMHGWFAVLVLRAVDRVGKGIRSAPRDAMLADAVPKSLSGIAFGLHRALDNLGAVGGALLAVLAVSAFGFAIPAVVALSALPGALALITLISGVREQPRQPLPPSRQADTTPIAPRFAWLLGLIALFTAARAAETFVVLRAHELGMSLTACLLLWALYSAAKSVAALLGGRLGDRFGHSRMLVWNWALFGLVLNGMGSVDTAAGWWAMAATYGIVFGLGEGVERAAVREVTPASAQGSAFGWYYMATGLIAIPAGLAFGAIWQYWSADLAFHCAAVVAGLAVVGLLAWRHTAPRTPLAD